MNKESDNLTGENDEGADEFLASEAKNRKRKRRKVLAIFAIVLFIFFVVPLIFVAIYKIKVEAELRAELAKIRAEGKPTNEAELKIWYENGNRFPEEGETTLDINSDENGALLYLQAFKLLKDDVPYKPSKEKPQPEDEDYEGWYKNQFVDSDEYIDNSELISVGIFEDKLFSLTSLPENILKLNEIYLKANEPSLVKARAAAKKPYCIFPGVTSILTSQSCSTLSPRRQLARLFSMNVKIYAEDGEIEKSINAVENGIRLTYSFKNAPFLLNYLVTIACKGIAYSNIQYLLNKASLNDNQLKRLSDIISQEPQQKPFLTSFAGDQLFILIKDTEKDIGRNLIAELLFNDYPLVTKWKLEPYGTFIAKQTGKIAHEQLLYLQTMRKFLKFPENNYASATKLDTELINQLPKHSLSFRINIFGSFLKMKCSYFRILAAQRNCITALAVARYKLKYKKLPDSLQELVPEFLPSVLIDPFDNKPLKYRRRDVTFRQAVKMSEKEKKEYSNGGKTTGRKRETKQEAFIEWNKPIDGYKVLDIIKPCYLIYSVSEDQEDNGGTPGEPNGRYKDITITVIDK